MTAGIKVNPDGSAAIQVGGVDAITLTSAGAATFVQPVTLTTPLGFSSGGSGQTTRQAAMDALAGAVTAGQYLRGDGTDVVMSAIQVADVPTLNQNTTGTARGITGDNTTFASVFGLPDTGGAGGWIFLGTWTGASQSGSKVNIELTIGTGYNATISQNAIYKIFFKTSNGSSSQAGSSGSFLADGMSWKFGPAAAVSNIRVIQNSTSSYAFYVLGSSFTGVNSCYQVTTAQGVWTNSGTLATPSGNFIDLPIYSVLDTSTGAGGDFALRAYGSPTTWPKPAGLKQVKVTVVGAGGNGGAAPATPGNDFRFGGGGGGGGAAIEWLPAPSIPGPVAVTAGGGTNSFGAFCSATAGAVGGSLGPGGAGGAGSGGTFNINGGGGGGAVQGGNASGGAGGSSILGGGAQGVFAPFPSVVGGANGGSFGGGGSGGAKALATPAAGGGAGAGGVVIVEEFY